MVPPQFTPYINSHPNHPAQMAKYAASDTDDSFSAYLWSLMGSKQIRRLYRALPVFTYWGTGPFREATPKGIPHQDLRCLAPTGSSLRKPKWCVLVFIIVFFIGIVPSLPLSSAKVNPLFPERTQIDPDYSFKF